MTAKMRPPRPKGGVLPTSWACNTWGTEVCEMRCAVSTPLLYDTLAPAAVTQLRGGTQYLRRAREDRELSQRPAVQTARRVMEELALLREGWDGYGALAISTRTRLNAWRAFSQFLDEAVVPEVLPTSNGTIAFEWSTSEADAYLEIGNTRFSMYVKPARGVPLYFDGDAMDIPPNVPSVLRETLEQGVLDRRTQALGAANSATTA